MELKRKLTNVLKNEKVSTILTDYLMLEIPFNFNNKECWIDIEIDTTGNEIKLLKIFIDGEEIDTNFITDEEILNLLNIY